MIQVGPDVWHAAVRACRWWREEAGFIGRAVVVWYIADALVVLGGLVGYLAGWSFS